MKLNLRRHTHFPLKYSPHYDCVISADEGGFIEYWRPAEPWDPPKNVPGLWEFKASTDLYHFKKVCPFPFPIPSSHSP